MKRDHPSICMAVLFCTFLAVLFLGGLLRGGEIYSYFENRMLAGKPAISAEGVLSGDYFQEMDSYLADHAPGRNTLMKLRTCIDLELLRRPVVNDVVVGDDLLLPYISYDRFDLDRIGDDTAALTENLAAVRDVVEACGGAFYYVAVPCQYAYFSEEYPWYLNNAADYTRQSREALAQSLVDAGVGYIDIGKVFEDMGSPPELGSRVDNHYPLPGAYQVYRTVLERAVREAGLDVEIVGEDALKPNVLPNRYLGSRNRKLFGLWDGGESLLWYTLPDIPFTRRDNGQDSQSYIYAMPQSPQDDVRYDFFMGGDIAETEIDTGRDGLPSVLIYGDSFTNAVECLLWTSFDEMRSLDMRHYTERTLGEYIRDYRPELVICVRDYEALLSTSGNGCGPD